MTTDRDLLLSVAERFCDAFASQRPLDDILSHFSTSDEPVAHEHGLQQLTPFTGRTFKGIDGIKDYFTLISDCLSYSDMHFSDYIVDTSVVRVSVRGQAKFTWKSTGNSWLEIFTYVLEFDDNLKVKKYEIWADPGAAYLASRGEIK